VTLLQADRPWWQLAVSHNRLGRFLVREPQVTLLASPSGWNFQGIGAQRDEEQAPPASPGSRPELSAEVRGAAVTLHRAGVSEPLLDVDGVDVTAHIKYSDQVRWLTIEPFRPLDRKQLTPAMCDNGLELVAPVLANSSWVQGEISLSIDELRLPLDRPRTVAGVDPPTADGPAARASGRLELHSVETGLKNPLLQQIADKVATLFNSQMPTRVRITDNSTVKFELRDRRMYHEGLAFGLPEISPSLILRTSGTVGLDKTLDLRVDVPVLIDLAFSGPIAQRVSGKTIQLAVTGTLDKPKVSLPKDKSFVQQFSSLLSDNPNEADGVASDDLVGLARDLLPAAKDAAENITDTLAKIRERRADRRAARNEMSDPSDRERNAALASEWSGSATGDALPPPPPESDVRSTDNEPRDEEMDETTDEEAAPRPRGGPLRRLFDRRRNRAE
jgi:hypothetical protein